MPRKRTIPEDAEQSVFAERLSSLMNRDKGTTQSALADYLGVQRQTVSLYILGKSSPSWETLAKIAQYFHVSADYLIGLSDTAAPDTDLRAVCAYTGLSETAVKLLRRSDQNERNIINILMENPFFEVMICSIESISFTVEECKRTKEEYDTLKEKPLTYEQYCEIENQIERLKSSIGYHTFNAMRRLEDFIEFTYKSSNAGMKLDKLAMELEDLIPDNPDGGTEA